MTEEEILLEIKPFTDACDKMLASKFIMIDKRISDVLKSIAKTQIVFDIIKECMTNFNFEREWNLATAKIGFMSVPEEPHKFVAFVFSILNCIDDKKISASEVLSKYFSKTENPAGPYGEFCFALVEKFKNVVVSKILNKSEYETIKKPRIILNLSKDVLSRLEFLAKDLKIYIQGLKKLKHSNITKGELIEIINTLIYACQKGNVEYIKTCVLAIKAGHGKDKEIDRRLIEILDITNKSFIDA